MKYTHLIADMQWSYSRINSFIMCPYQFLLKYIKGQEEPTRQFFSDYGSFMHKIIEKRLTGQIPQEDLVVYYLTHYAEKVKGAPPSFNILNKYLAEGKEYLKDFVFPYTPKVVEQKYEFMVDDFSFVGVIDCVAQNDKDLIIIDNKSRALKPRSGRSKPTASDKELDEYLRQLYLYSIPIKDNFGEYPNLLKFNCFRTKTWISEPFVYDDFIKAKTWATSIINTIINCDDWSPKYDYFKCKYICDQHQDCEYFKLNER